MIRRRLSAPLLLAAAAALAACSHPAPPPAPAPQQTAAAPTIDSSRIRDSLANAKRMADSLAAERDREGAAVAAARNTLLAKIYFDFDKSDLTDQDRATLDAKIPILNGNPGLRLRIEGNCDKRGSDEYNLALGPAPCRGREAVPDGTRSRRRAPGCHQLRRGATRRRRRHRGGIRPEPAR